MAKNVYIGSSLVYDVEYVESEKVHFTHKIPILNLEEKNQRNIRFGREIGEIRKLPKKTGGG